jgi:7-dehydrocholesterol reductase
MNHLVPSKFLLLCMLGLWLLQWTLSLSNLTGLAAWSYSSVLTALVASLNAEMKMETLWPSWLLLQSAIGMGICTALYFCASRPGKGIMDFYSGIDLHPLVNGVSVKLFCASRIGMMSWGLWVIVSGVSWTHAQSGIPCAVVVSFALQLAYIQRFFSWEHHYLNTMDQQHDRAGFMIIWGCLVVVPGLYALSAIQSAPGVYNAEQSLSTAGCIACFLTGMVSLACLSESDDQKVRVRADPETATVFRKKATFIKTESGSILVTCGAWGMARHLHYLFEVICALSWTAPVAGTNWKGYAYVVFLFVLLIQRTFRDDERCAQKYKTDWEKYCKLVPYKILPRVF